MKQSKMSKMDIMNVMGDAADKKAKMNANPEMNDHDEDDMPGNKSPKSGKSKQVAAIKSQEKAGGKMPPKKAY